MKIPISEPYLVRLDNWTILVVQNIGGHAYIIGRYRI